MTYPSPTDLVRVFHETYGHAIRETPTLDIPERKLRVELVREEAGEYAEAESTDDLIEVADALGDIVYVVSGASLTHGLNIEPATLAAQAHLRAAITDRKPSLDVPERRALVQELRSAFKAYERAEAQDDLLGIQAALSALNAFAYRAALAHGIDLDIVLAEIQRSNMSKLGADGLPIRRADGKILKGPNFFPPNIRDILNAQGANLTA